MLWRRPLTRSSHEMLVSLPRLLLTSAAPLARKACRWVSLMVSYLSQKEISSGVRSALLRLLFIFYSWSLLDTIVYIIYILCDEMIPMFLFSLLVYFLLKFLKDLKIYELLLYYSFRYRYILQNKFNCCCHMNLFRDSGY